MLPDSCVMMKLMTGTASSDKHHYRSSDSFFNIDANGFHIKLSTILILGQNANHQKTSGLCVINIITELRV